MPEDSADRPLFVIRRSSGAGRRFYTAAFPNSAITTISRYGKAARAMEAIMKMKKFDVAELTHGLATPRFHS